MNLDDKKIFIHKNINKINNHNDIINYIKTNNIKYTLNDNGFFINISYIGDKHIEYIYNILRYYINNNNNNQLFIDKRKELIDLNNKNNINTNIKKYNISLSEFTEEEQNIIKKSKKYKI